MANKMSLPFPSQFFRTCLTTPTHQIKAKCSVSQSVPLTGAGKQQSTELWSKHSITTVLYMQDHLCESFKMKAERAWRFVLHQVYTLSALPEGRGKGGRESSSLFWFWWGRVGKVTRGVSSKGAVWGGLNKQQSDLLCMHILFTEAMPLFNHIQ